MSKPARPENFPWLSPYLIVVDAQKACDFYEKAFGFTFAEKSLNDEGQAVHVEMRYQDAVIMMGSEEACGGEGFDAKSPVTSGQISPVGLYIYVEDVDAWFKHAVECGATPVIEPKDTFWGDRMCALMCPDHHCWNFATHLGEPAK